MVGGDAVLEAVRATRVLGHVAAHGAGGLARRVGHIVESEGKHGFGEAGVHYAGLHHGATLNRVHPENPVQPGERDEHGIGVGQRTARQAGAGAPGHERHLDQVQQTDDLPHLSRAPRNDHHAGHRLVGGKSVHGVGRQLGPPVAHPAGSNDPAQRIEQGGVHWSATMSGAAPPLPLV